MERLRDMNSTQCLQNIQEIYKGRLYSQNYSQPNFEACYNFRATLTRLSVVVPEKLATLMFIECSPI